MWKKLGFGIIFGIVVSIFVAIGYTISNYWKKKKRIQKKVKRFGDSRDELNSTPKLDCFADDILSVSIITIANPFYNNLDNLLKNDKPENFYEEFNKITEISKIIPDPYLIDEYNETQINSWKELFKTLSRGGKDLIVESAEWDKIRDKKRKLKEFDVLTPDGKYIKVKNFPYWKETTTVPRPHTYNPKYLEYLHGEDNAGLLFKYKQNQSIIIADTEEFEELVNMLTYQEVRNDGEFVLTR